MTWQAELRDAVSSLDDPELAGYAFARRLSAEATARFRLRVARDGQGMTQDWSLADDTLPGTAAVATQAPAAETGLCVHAPLPGTFYRAPAPGAPPFVEPGATVSPDTVVGIIETMKLMNPVHAGVHGVIDAILVDNATMIAKGEALMRLTEPQA